MKVLLTGISGFIGHHTAEALHRRGHALRGLVRRTSDRSGVAHLPVEFAEGDVLDRPSLDRALQGCDAVVHLAGLTKAVTSEDFFRVNAGGTRNVAQAVVAAGDRRERRPRLVHVSSQAAAGPAAPGRVSEEADVEAPLSRYGRSKLEAERLIREVAGDAAVTIVRPPMVYGPRDRDILAAFQLARRAFGVFLHPGFSEKRYSIVHGADLGEGIALALEKGDALAAGDRGRGVYYVTDGAAYTWADLGRALARAVGRRPFILPVPHTVSTLVAAAQEAQALITRKPPLLGFDKIRDMRGDNFVCSCERARRDLGFAPAYDVPRGFQQTADWYLANGWL